MKTPLKLFIQRQWKNLSQVFSGFILSQGEKEILRKFHIRFMISFFFIFVFLIDWISAVVVLRNVY
jgi:hypothetical protein